MKIKFLGVGSAFTTADYYQSNMLLTARNGRKMLIDCGGDIRFALSECGFRLKYFGREINAIYISHLHADHIGGLEGVAFNTLFDAQSPPCKLFVPESLIQDLWNHSLKGGLMCVQDKEMEIDDYFACSLIRENGPFQWENISFSPVKMLHTGKGCKNPYSFGLLITDETRSVFISTDTQFQPNLLGEIAGRVDLMFHDCETQRAPSGVHAHFDELCTLPFGLRQKMWLYHYQPDPPQNPEKEGFRGFVAKGQEFDF
jgi:ribonuclease BN (tRNA processing enzyme)